MKIKKKKTPNSNTFTYSFFYTKCLLIVCYLSARVEEKSLLTVAEGPPAVTLGLTGAR